MAFARGAATTVNGRWLPDDELVGLLRARAAEVDGRLTITAYDRLRRPGDPAGGTVRYRLGGSWNAALAAAGLEEHQAPRRRWTEAEAIDAVAGWLAGATDTRYAAYLAARAASADLPSEPVLRRFGGFKMVRQAALRRPVG